MIGSRRACHLIKADIVAVTFVTIGRAQMQVEGNSPLELHASGVVPSPVRLLRLIGFALGLPTAAERLIDSDQVVN